MAAAFISPVALRWAAKRAGLSSSDIAAGFGKSPDEVQRWLDGDAAPTFKQAQTLARRLRVPFGYLFLTDPPEDDFPLVDFRRHSHGGSVPPSLELRDVVDDVLLKQDWYRDFRIDNDDEALSFVGRFTMTTQASVIAQDISTELRFADEVRPNAKADDFLRAFVQQVEALGILVMRNGIVRHATNRPLSVDEFRGFSIADAMAPVIFVNNADSPAAQVFTLAHELGHIWLGLGGVSDAEVTLASEGNSDVEAHCNDIAGELLLPWTEVGELWSSSDKQLAAWAPAIARSFHVSTVMVARQLWSHHQIDRQAFFSFYEAEKQKWIPAPGSEAGSSGGNFWLSVPIRNSRLLTTMLLDSVRSSEMSSREASRLLGVKPAGLSKLRETIGQT